MLNPHNNKTVKEQELKTVIAKLENVKCHLNILGPYTKKHLVPKICILGLSV